MLRVTFLGRKWLWRSSQCAVCTVRGCGFVGCGRHDLRTSLESALLLSLSSQLRPLRHYIPHPLYSLATSLFFVITSFESTKCSTVYQPLCPYIPLQSRNLSLLRHYILRINECSPVSQPLCPYIPLQSLNLSVFASIYSIAISPFLDITSYQLTNSEIIRSRQLSET